MRSLTYRYIKAIVLLNGLGRHFEDGAGEAVSMGAVYSPQSVFGGPLKPTIRNYSVKRALRAKDTMYKTAIQFDK
jgi:hypothetical protein